MISPKKGVVHNLCHLDRGGRSSPKDDWLNRPYLTGVLSLGVPGAATALLNKKDSKRGVGGSQNLQFWDNIAYGRPQRTFLPQDRPNLVIKMIPTNSQQTFQNKMKYWYYFPLWFLVNHKNLWKKMLWKKKLIHFVNPFILGHFILDWCIMCM